MPKRIEHADIRPSYTIVASLVAARTEIDGNIQLRIANPADPATTLLVAFPSATEAQADQNSRTAARMARARQAFAEGIVLPSFEDFTLLYGVAQLTITTAGARHQAFQVLDFEPLESGPPPSCRCQSSKPVTAACASAARRQRWPAAMRSS